MNERQTIPIIARLAPPLMLVGLIALAIKLLFFGKDKEKKPETLPADAGADNCRKEAEITAFHQILPETAAVHQNPVETTAFRQIPAEISVKPAVVSLTKDVTQTLPLPPIKRRVITREDVATVFQRGARPLTRTAAVAALRSLGFGRAAAYHALSEDGNFASWLQFAPDGTITWKG